MENVLAELKPNINKIFLLSVLKFMGVVALIIGAALYLKSVVGFKVYSDVLRELGIEITTDMLVSMFIGAVLMGMGFMLLVHYIRLGQVKYILLGDKLVSYQNIYIVQLNKDEVPYQNIKRIVFEPIPLLNTGHITIELSGMKKASTELKFIDNAEKLAAKIHDYVNQYKAKYYLKHAKEEKIQTIFEKRGF